MESILEIRADLTHCTLIWRWSSLRSQFTCYYRDNETISQVRKPKFDSLTLDEIADCIRQATKE